MLPELRVLWFSALFDGTKELSSKKQDLPTTLVAEFLPLVGVLGMNACYAVVSTVAQIYKSTARKQKERREENHGYGWRTLMRNSKRSCLKRIDIGAF
jgi:beta-lactamase regulating signal transducer with metallopeptidase domain